MYKALNGDKIIAISETYNQLKRMNKTGVVEDTEHTCEDYEQYNGEYLLKSEIPEPTQEEQSEKRASAYREEVDPITCHIQRLEDEEQTPEIEQEIANLKEERSEKVQDIKERYPYPVEEE